MTYIAVDLHVHTVYSGDSRIKVVDLVEYCREVGLGVAVTDHETFSGGFIAYKYVRESGYDVVVLCGAELMTNLGAVVVLLPEPQDVKYIPKDLRLLVKWARDRGFITIADLSKSLSIARIWAKKLAELIVQQGYAYLKDDTLYRRF